MSLADIPEPTDHGLEAPPCPLCGGVRYRLLLSQTRDRLYGKPGVFQVQACSGCGLAATWPRPAASRLGDYYRNAYSGKALARTRAWQTGWLGRWAARARLRAVESLGRLGPLGPLSAVLDVGCGYGEFLRTVRRRSDCQVCGIDMDSEMARLATSHSGGACVAGEWMQHDWGGQRFELITFFQSLEHFPDPVAALQRAQQQLAPDGLCVVELPDFSSPWRHVFGRFWMPLVVPQHLYHFDPRSLSRALEQAGLRPLRRASMWFPIESTVSLGLALHALARRLDPGFRLDWRRASTWLLLVPLVLWWPLVELPTQTLFWLLGRTGNQLVIARKA